MIELSYGFLSVREQCRLLEVNRSTLYYKPCTALEDTDLANEVHELWMEMPFYGYRRIAAELRRRGYVINQKRVLRLMREMNLQALYPRPRTTVRCPEHKIFPYLLRGLTIERPNQVWATDITYIKMPQGFGYLVALIDVYSRFIVAWRLSNTLETDFCLEMLEEALLKEVPEILNTRANASK
jgi:putative transposase